MSLWSDLSLGVTGLQASTNALNTVAHNITNADTEGYTRQQVYQGDRESVWVGRTPLNQQQVGLGVSIGEVRQVRNVFLDKYYRQESGRQAFYDECYNSAVEVQDYLGEMQGTEFGCEFYYHWVAFQFTRCNVA